MLLDIDREIVLAFLNEQRELGLTPAGGTDFCAAAVFSREYVYYKLDHEAISPQEAEALLHMRYERAYRAD